MIDFEQKTPGEIGASVAARVRVRRKELGLTQQQLSSKAGMSLASYKRFEQKAWWHSIRLSVSPSLSDTRTTSTVCSPSAVIFQ